MGWAVGAGEGVALVEVLGLQAEIRVAKSSRVIERRNAASARFMDGLYAFVVKTMSGKYIATCLIFLHRLVDLPSLARGVFCIPGIPLWRGMSRVQFEEWKPFHRGG